MLVSVPLAAQALVELVVAVVALLALAGLAHFALPQIPKQVLLLPPICNLAMLQLLIFKYLMPLPLIFN